MGGVPSKEIASPHIWIVLSAISIPRQSDRLFYRVGPQGAVSLGSQLNYLDRERRPNSPRPSLPECLVGPLALGICVKDFLNFIAA